MWGGKNKVVAASLLSVSSPFSSPLTGYVALRNEGIPRWNLEYFHLSQRFLKGVKALLIMTGFGGWNVITRARKEFLDTSVDWNAYRRGLEALSSYSHPVCSLLRQTTWVNAFIWQKYIKCICGTWNEMFRNIWAADSFVKFFFFCLFGAWLALVPIHFYWIVFFLYGKKNVIKAWNDTKMSKWFYWVNYTFKSCFIPRLELCITSVWIGNLRTEYSERFCCCFFSQQIKCSPFSEVGMCEHATFQCFCHLFALWTLIQCQTAQ